MRSGWCQPGGAERSLKKILGLIGDNGRQEGEEKLLTVCPVTSLRSSRVDLSMAQANPDHNHHVSEGDVKAPNILERAKEEIEAIMHSAKPHHHGETHGTSPEIDQNTPVDEVKAPNFFERAKEEVEAIVEAIHPKKESDHNSSADKEGGFWGFLARSENEEDAKEAAESHKRVSK